MTGWLKVSGNLSTYFTRNSPESVFVPSGTFRHDSSCCLLPINTCFQFPYVLEQQSIEGRVFSDFSTSKVSASGGTGSRTGSSVAYTLTVNLKPAPELVIKAGQKKCFTFFEIGARCFSAPLIVLSDKLVEKSIESYTVTLHYQNNLLLIVLIVLLIGAVLIYTNRGKIRKTLNPVRKNIEGTKK
ncbi:MAG: hypothetical protein GOV00_03225 [Candidatus Altiarchaeota archaeon]|nr:hypothetical protein [Candidatus Altiarchaeota archaeon]